MISYDGERCFRFFRSDVLPLGSAGRSCRCESLLLQLLNRVFNIMREKNPDMVAGEKRKFVMKPPQVVRVGTKKTSFVNFTDICKL